MHRVPFVFITDFEAEKIECYTFDELEDEDIEFSIDGSSFCTDSVSLDISPIDFDQYKKKFEQILEQIRSGNTYLLNLTQPTPIESSHSLKQIYDHSSSRFKLRYRDKFICFSPERFIQIRDNTIYTYPMKGTIDASVDGAEETVLNSPKELAEHVMVVDLLRNDLSMISSSVKVERFRYIEKIRAGERDLLQVSSKISGTLDSDWRESFSKILKTILPAGSITGAPKRSTVKIIKDIEGYNRGYFSGIFGIYDGCNVESFVMIRFIEQENNTLVYKSGGGITLDSVCQDEYSELIEKIYIPQGE